MKKGIFITLEGGEGVGKSTQTNLLEKAIYKNNLTCLKTREPGGTKGAEILRDLVVNKLYDFDDITDLLLLNGARREHLSKLIFPNLENHHFIICDRFLLSTIVYQGIVAGIDLKHILKLHEICSFNYYPDLTIVIDMIASDSLKRLQNRCTNNSIDNKPQEFHDSIAKAYRQCTEFYQGKVENINGSYDILTIHQEIIKGINKSFNLTLEPLSYLELKA
ncbi:Thymidylate kinase [Candidatus Hepatincolaceae symbiont of Richtersius coronifer]